MYDREGMCGFRYYNGSKWSTYTYLKNALGDVRFIKDNNGNCLVKYSYDPFGNVTAEALGEGGEELAELNPIRYRGYYYDAESGLYYLLTRYYDPAVGQFISPDSFEYLDPHTVGGIDLYAYCSGNPVMYTDPYGTTEWWEFLLGIAVVVVVAAVTVATAGVAAYALGASSAVVGGTMTGAAIGAGISGGVNLVMQSVVQGHIDYGSLAFDTAVGGITGAASGMAGALATPAKSAMRKLVMKGAQAGLNIMISNTSYVMSSAASGEEVTLSGLALSTVNGFTTGFWFKNPKWSTIASMIYETIMYFI